MTLMKANPQENIIKIKYLHLYVCVHTRICKATQRQWRIKSWIGRKQAYIGKGGVFLLVLFPLDILLLYFHDHKWCYGSLCWINVYSRDLKNHMSYAKSCYLTFTCQLEQFDVWTFSNDHTHVITYWYIWLKGC